MEFRQAHDRFLKRSASRNSLKSTPPTYPSEQQAFLPAPSTPSTCVSVKFSPLWQPSPHWSALHRSQLPSQQSRVSNFYLCTIFNILLTLLSHSLRVWCQRLMPSCTSAKEALWGNLRYCRKWAYSTSQSQACQCNLRHRLSLTSQGKLHLSRSRLFHFMQA